MSIAVTHPGMFTTVQDLGRVGHQRFGVPVSGAMDAWALRVANMLVGNDDAAAALEVTLLGPALAFDAPTLVAVTGADLGVTIGNTRITPGHAAWLPAGSTLRFTGGPHGCRAYVAVAGGIDVPPVLGSRSTYVRATLGGLGGRALRAGDILPCGQPSRLSERIASRLSRGGERPTVATWGAGPSLHTAYSHTPSVRLVDGTHAGHLTPKSREELLGGEFRVSSESDRMGYRLEGTPLRLAQPLELLSEGVTFGTVQLPPSGDPIILMADRQTTGGYPRIGEVAAVDLPLLAQLRPGDHVRFQPCSLDDAQHAFLARERDLAQARGAIALLHS